MRIVKTIGPLLMVLTFAVGPSSAKLQETFAISSEASCPECEVRMTRVATLGGNSDPHGKLCDFFHYPAMDSRGRFYLPSSCEPGKILVFERNGNFLQSIGRYGQGPLEFEQIRSVWITADDFLFVVDQGLSLTVLSPEYELVRALPIRLPAPPIDVILNNDGSSVQVLELHSPERVGFPFHLLDNNNNILRSFGAVVPVFRWDQPLTNWRSITSAGEGNIWSAHRLKYQLELWNTGGTLIHTLVRNAAWFQPQEFLADDNVNEVAHLVDLYYQSEGQYLWVLITPSESDRAELGTTVIEVIDPVNAELIAKGESGVFLQRWLGDMLTSSYSENRDGDAILDIWDVKLVQPPEQ